MIRFFVTPEELRRETLMLCGENAQHAQVLRLRVGEKLLLCDGQGTQRECTVESITREGFFLRGEAPVPSVSEPRVRVSVYMAYPKADKLEHVIQKATELGAYEIVAFPSARCVSRPEEKSLPKKRERWQRIACSAAEQSGRGRIPQVVLLNSRQQAFARASEASAALLFYENEHSRTLTQTLSTGNLTSVSLVTGPEGGFAPEEVDEAEKAGLQVCTLGRRILRCETAPLCALSAVLFAAGEF